MGEFGWAYVSGSQIPDGLEGSLQYKKGNEISGSTNLVFDNTSNTLVLSGTLDVSGAINTNELNINVTNKNVTNISLTGSTKFGDTSDDTHIFTGSMDIKNGTLLVSASAGSTLIYEVTTAGRNALSTDNQNKLTTVGSKYFISSSVADQRGLLNSEITISGVTKTLTEEATLVRADNPALVVTGAAIFNDPMSIKGGIYGASPVNIYAPLLFRRDDLGDTEVPDEEMKIEKGKFVGNLVLSSSNDNHGLFIQGAGRIVMNSLKDIEGAEDLGSSEPAPEILMVNNTKGRSSAPVLDMRNLNNVEVSEHPFFLNRRHSLSRFNAGEIRWRGELPVLTGSVSSSASEYSTVNYDSARLLVQSDPRRGSHLVFFQTLDANIDPEYEGLDAASSSDRDISGSAKPIIHPDSPLYDAATDNYSASLANVISFGAFGNPGQGNIYGLKRGLTVFGSLYPSGPNIAKSGYDKTLFQTEECTLGHPVNRWGDMYIHDDRYIRWGQRAGDRANDAYKRFYNSNPLTASARIDSGSVIFGYNSSSAFLEVSGATTYLNDNLNITGSGYINFGLTKGTSGYGFRDNSGTLEFKNSTGDWTEFGTGTGNSSIGAAEDGDYTDGLFTDFVTGTLVGVPIDRFNEVLKILAPSPAPALSRIDYTNTVGSNAKLTFDASNQITDYANSSTTAGFDAVVEDGLYESETSGSNERLGIYNGTQDIEGALNFNVTASTTNGNIAYSDDSFGNAETGSLKLELNGAIIHTVDLASHNSGNSYLNSTGSGFTNLSVTSSTLDGNGANWGSIFNYRTAQYKIDTLDQRAGWNYARMIHTVGSTDYATNYVEWINDPDGAALALSTANQTIDEVSLIGSKYVSGVQYNTDLTAKYKVDINNMYRNVYPDGNVISFNTTNADSITVQDLDPIGASEDQTKIVQVTGSVNNNQNTLLNGTITVSLNATHPLKSNLSSAGAATLTGMLIDNDTSGNNSNLSETFIDEDFRITSGAYDTQNSVTAGAATWNSQNHMTSSGAAGHEDGLLFYNRKMYSPRSSNVANNGNFSGLANVSANQPNYSGLAGMRTFYRKIQNDSGAAIRDVKITMQKYRSQVTNKDMSTQSDNNEINIFIKVPDQTGWMKANNDFSFGSVLDNDGALIDGASDNSNITSNNEVSAVHCLTFGTASVADNGYFVVKILAHTSWLGYIENLQFQLGASDVSAPTESFLLDDLDLDDTAGETAKLSFGTSNGVGGYINVAGGVGSMGAVNSNGTYTDNSDTNRGVFKTIEVMGGTLNEDVNQSTAGSFLNYTAKSFKDAHTGSLLLIVNDATASTLSLSNLTSNNNLSSDTGFSVGTVGYSTTTDGIPDYTKSYRTGTFSIGTSQQRSGWNYARVIHNLDKAPMQIITVTFVRDGGNKFYFDGAGNVTLSLKVGNTYRFQRPGFSFSTHPLKFSTTSGGSHNGGSEYTTGVTVTTSYVQIIPEASVTLYPYCTVHSGMGGSSQLNITAATKTQTNYVEWVVDTSGAVDNTAVTTPTLSDFGHTDIYHQSGIKYYASNPTASFDFLASNFYSNVHSNEANAISFPTASNCQVTNIRAVGTGITTFDSGVSQTGMPALNNNADCETTAIQITGTLQYNGATPSIFGSLSTFADQDVAVNATVLHPLKSNKTTSTVSKANLMVYSGSVGSTNLNTEEYFNTETYRIVSNNYANQADITGSSQVWNSQTAMNNGGTHDDGMVTAAGYALSPFKIGVAGNTGHASLQAPAGNPDYSSLTSDTRTFYRYFKNNSGVLKYNNMSISLHGDANLVGKSGAHNGSLGANKNIHVELKVPSDPNYTGGDDRSTGWCDVIKDWDDTEDLAVDGAGILSVDPLNQTVPPGGRVLPLEFQGKGIYNNQYFVVKISVHKDWTGYLSRIRMAYS